MSRLRLEAVEQGMAVRTLGLFSESRVSSGQLLLCSRSSLIGLITLDVKCAGARSAGNPHATCDVRVLETESRQFLNGPEEGNLGHSQGGAYGPPRQHSTLPRFS